tara:strand:- start:343 stop:1029 length:687 start_codon:yes stop_codon:yes gene_type:complete
MMLQLIDKRKIYLYVVILFFLLSIHNINTSNFLNEYFKVKKIIINTSIEEKTNKEISNSLSQFYNFNIFSINKNEIINILENFEIISEYKIEKQYPSIIKVEIKQTKILAYYFNNNQKILIGENGKKIRNEIFFKENLPLIVGKVKIKNFLKLKDELITNGFVLSDFTKFYSFKSNRWDLLYQNKFIVKLPIENVEESIKIFRNLINNSNVKKLRIIDLRIKNKIILS